MDRRGASRRSRRRRRALPQPVARGAARRPRDRRLPQRRGGRARRSRRRPARRSPRPTRHLLRRRAAGLVGASTVVGDATAPARRERRRRRRRRRASIAAGGRVDGRLARERRDASVRAFAAMSTDGGGTFGPAQQIDPDGGGNQVAPELAATADGRVDVAYLWDRGHRRRRATTASADPPLPGATTEAWAQARRRPERPGDRSDADRRPAAPLGRRLGVATSAWPRARCPPPSSRSRTRDVGRQDMHVDGAPARHDRARDRAVQTVTASKNATTIVTVRAPTTTATRSRGRSGAQPSDAGLERERLRTPRAAQFTFHAANKVGLETFEAVATDGVAGHETHATITVNVENDPPEIICRSLIAHEDSRSPIDRRLPASRIPTATGHDRRSTARSAAPSSSNGRHVAVRARRRTAPRRARSCCTRADETSSDGRTIIVTSSPPGRQGHAHGAGRPARRAPSRAAWRCASAAQAIDATGHTDPVVWNFGDGSPARCGPCGRPPLPQARRVHGRRVTAKTDEAS